MKKYTVTISLIGILISSSVFFVSSQQTQAATSGVTCMVITYDLWPNSKDSRTQGQVSKLQNFLIAEGYLNATPTGNVGPLTEAALQQFQKAQNIVSSGNYVSTGYGATGPKTRAAIKNVSCNGGTSTSTSVSALPLGCNPGYKFSTLTGQLCLAGSTTTVATTISSGGINSSGGTSGNSGNNSGNGNTQTQNFPAGTILVPGSGFTGATPQPATVGSGAGSDAEAIARWDVVPYQTFSGNFNVGVVAFHMSGIDHVAFSVNNGPWTNISQMTLNPQTNVTEYWATLRASDFQDGPVEVRAIAYPTVGIPRVLAGQIVDLNGNNSLFLFSNAHNLLVATSTATIYVSQSGSNTTGDGSLNRPFGTLLDKALDTVADGGTIIIKDPGTYYVGNGTNRSERNNQYWITVQAGQGVTNQNTTIISPNQQRMIPRINKLHWYGVGFDASKTIQYSPSPNQLVWFDNVYWTYNGWQNTDANEPVETWGYSIPDHVYFTDSNAYNGVYGLLASDLCRNCSAEKISGLPFGSPGLLINATVENFNQNWEQDPGATLDNLYHRDIWHVWDGTENKIVYGLTATNNISATAVRIESQAGPLGAAGVASNYAFVNMNVVTTPIPIGSQSNSGTQYVALTGNENHIYFYNDTFPNNDFAFDDGTPFNGHNVVINNDGLHWGTYDTEILHPENVPTGVTFKNDYKASTEDWAPSNLATSVSGSQISLTWNPGQGTTLDTTDDATNIRRSDDNGQTWKTISTRLPGTTATYSDTSITSPGTYLYVVEMNNNHSGAYEYSNVVSVTVTTITSSQTGQGSIGSRTQTSRPPSTPASGLVALWTFDTNTASGTTAYDTSGNNLDATLVNNPQFAAGHSGQALSLNGSNQYADIPNSNLLNFGTNPYSISAWVYPTQPASTARILTKRLDTSVGDWISLDETSGQSPVFNFSSGNSGSTKLYLNTKYNYGAFNTWYHVVATRDASGCKFLYVNGSLVSSGECENPILNINNTADLQIGAWRASDLFSGTIDDVRIYNRVLSSSEVQQLYNGTLSMNTIKTNSMPPSNLANVLTSTLNLLPHAIPGTSYYNSLITSLSNTLHSLGIK